MIAALLWVKSTSLDATWKGVLAAMASLFLAVVAMWNIQVGLPMKMKKEHIGHHRTQSGNAGVE